VRKKSIESWAAGGTSGEPASIRLALLSQRLREQRRLSLSSGTITLYRHVGKRGPVDEGTGPEPLHA
jgi:hypothetical protein